MTEEVHIVTLEGHNTASIGDLTHTNNKGGVVGPVLRKAVKEGLLTEDSTVLVKRNGTTCFLPCKVSVFTSKTLKEDDKGLRYVKYVPYDNPHYKQESELQ